MESITKFEFSIDMLIEHDFIEYVNRTLLISFNSIIMKVDIKPIIFKVNPENIYHGQSFVAIK